MNYFGFKNIENRGLPAVFLFLVFSSALFFFWPGIHMSDTFARWAAVLTIQGILNVSWSLEQWLAPMMTIFMLPFGFHESITPYFTFFQVAYLFFAVLAWIYCTSGERPFWVPMTFVLPVVYLYVPFIVPDVWTLAALIITIAMLTSDKNLLNPFSIFLFLVSCIVLFGFRQNSLILLPLFFFLIVKRKPKDRWERHIVLFILMCALLLISVGPRLVGFGDRTSSAAAPTWELVGMLRIAKESRFEIDSEYTLDGIADTNLAIKNHSFSTIDTLLWGADAAVSTGVILENSRELRSRWLGLVVNQPNLYVAMKIETYKCMLGLCDKYLQIHIAPQQPMDFLEGKVDGFSSNAQFAGSILQSSSWLAQNLKIIFLPIFWVPIGLLAFVSGRRSYNYFDWVLICGATIYMASFFVFNQAASFRYMFPAYVIYTAYQLRFMGRIFYFMISKYNSCIKR